MKDKVGHSYLRSRSSRGLRSVFTSHELSGLAGCYLAFHQVFVHAELSFELFERNDSFVDLLLVAAAFSLTRDWVHTRFNSFLAFPLLQVVRWNALHAVDFYIESVSPGNCVGDSVGAEFVDLVNVNRETTGGIESSWAVRAAEMFGLLVR